MPERLGSLLWQRGRRMGLVAAIFGALQGHAQTAPGLYVPTELTALGPRASLSRLANGMELLVFSDSSQPVVHLAWVCTGGRSAAGLEHGGAPELWSELLPMFAPQSGYGRPWNSRLMPDHLMLETALPWRQWKLAVADVATRLQRPMPDSVELVLARANLSRRWQAGTAWLPTADLKAEVLKLLWGNQAVLRAEQPDFALVGQCGYRCLESFRRSYLQPSASLLVVHGPLDGAEVARVADSALGRWQPPAGTALPALRFPERAADTAFTLLNDHVAVPSLVLAWPLPGVLGNARENLLGQCMAQWLRLSAGPLQQRLLRTGLAQGLQVTYKPGVYRSSLEIGLVPTGPKLAECLRSLWAVLDSLNAPQWQSPILLDAAKRQLQLQHRLATDGGAALLQAAAQAWTHEGLRNWNDTEADLQRLDAGAFAQAVERHLQQNPLVCGLLVPTSLRWTLEASVNPLDYRPKPVPVPVHTVLDTLLPAVPPVNTTANDTAPQPPRKRPDIQHLEAALDSLTLLFPFDKALVSAASQQRLRALAQLTVDHPELRVFVDGHTDSQGSASYNRWLSQKRAEQVRQMLIARFGVAPQRLVARGFGESQLAVPENQPGDRALNRRVEFNVYEDLP